MVAAKESYRFDQEDEDASINLLELDPHSHDEEAGETLSLCDLPIYSDESIEDDHTSSLDNEHSFFEFLTADFSVSNSTYSESDNIIFCGKLIPYKNPSSFEDAAKIKPEKSKLATNCNYLTKSRPFSNGNLKPSAIDDEDRRGVKSFKSCSIPKNSECIARKRRSRLKKNELPGERGTVLESSPPLRMKSRWFLFLFGSGARIPKEMELSELRTRQWRSSRSAIFRPASEMETVKGSSRKKGLWKLLRALIMGL